MPASRTPLMLLLWLLLGCPLPPVPPPVDDSNISDCAPACETLEQLGCDSLASDGEDEIAGTADDASCVKVCTTFVQQGMPLRPRCISKASSCDQIDLVCMDPG